MGKIRNFSLIILMVTASSSTNAQNWNQILKAVASDRALYDYFGYSVSISGDYAIIGAWRESEHDSVYLSGSAYIFKNTKGTWEQSQKIVASDRDKEDFFGRSVAIYGEYAIVGAFQEDHDASGVKKFTNAGSAYIFKNISGTWTQIQKIVAFDRSGNDLFGSSVALSDNYAIVGAFQEGEDVSGENYMRNSGSAYIFKNNNGTWTEVQKITSPERAVMDEFGNSVSISGDYAIVGAWLEDEDTSEDKTASSAGSAYIFKNSSGTWALTKKIVASDRTTQDNFGISVAISGDYAIVGAYEESEDVSGGNSAYDAGSAYIFKNTNGTWAQVQKIVASDRASSDYFGYSVAINGDYAIVGAYAEDEDVSTIQTAGSAYIFKNTSGTWTEVQKNVASDRASQDKYGYSVAIWGGHAIVGAIGDDGGTGSAYIIKNSDPVNINNAKENNSINIFPNPSNGIVSITLGNEHDKFTVLVTNPQGEIVQRSYMNNMEKSEIKIPGVDGIYFLQIITSNKKYQPFLVIKQN